MPLRVTYHSNPFNITACFGQNMLLILQNTLPVLGETTAYFMQFSMPFFAS